MVEFFKTGKGVNLEVLTTATLSKLEEIKEKTASGHFLQYSELDLSDNLAWSNLTMLLKWLISLLSHLKALVFMLYTTSRMCIIILLETRHLHRFLAICTVVVLDSAAIIFGLYRFVSHYWDKKGSGPQDWPETFLSPDSNVWLLQQEFRPDHCGLWQLAGWFPSCQTTSAYAR